MRKFLADKPVGIPNCSSRQRPLRALARLSSWNALPAPSHQSWFTAPDGRLCAAPASEFVIVEKLSAASAERRIGVTLTAAPLSWKASNPTDAKGCAGDPYWNGAESRSRTWRLSIFVRNAIETAPVVPRLAVPIATCAGKLLSAI